MGVSRFGAYSSHVVVNESYIRPIPEGWSMEQASGFLCQALTAWYGLVEIGGLNPPSTKPTRVQEAMKGKVVLVQSAAGGVGLWALNTCQICNAIPVAVVGTPEKKDFLIENKGLRPDQIIIRSPSSAEFSEQLKQALAFVKTLDTCGNRKIEGFDIVFDAVAGDYFPPSYNSLARGGRYVIFGAAQYIGCCGDSPNWIR